MDYQIKLNKNDLITSDDNVRLAIAKSAIYRRTRDIARIGKLIENKDKIEYDYRYFI